MAKIHILSPEESLKIAAGEVIERPAHIVKELIENSVDAGATKITLTFEKAGKQLIQITDDGCGMEPQDAQNCFLAHATSKIRNLSDLEFVQTFGFRGEALASISAVAKVELTTRTREDATGSKIIYEGARFKLNDEVACPPGTDIKVHDLFFNTPVRKKFLKTDDTEWNAVFNCIQAFCFAYPEISFKIIHNGKMVISAPAVSSLHERAHQLWHDVSSQLIPFETSHKDLKISGLVSPTTTWKYNRSHLFYFVNNRWVKNTELSKGVMKGYAGGLPQDKFPVAVIFVSLPHHELDVNVHPKKEEVKFAHPGIVQTTVASAVKNALEEAISTKLQVVELQAMSPSQEAPKIIPLPSQPLPDILATTPKFGISPEVFQSSKKNDYMQPTAQLINTFTPSSAPTTNKSIIQEIQSSREHTESYKLIGQIFDTYIIGQSGQSIIIVDQHAAHERILYEKFAHVFNQQDGTTLLFPEVITLQAGDQEVLFAYKNFFAKQGLTIDDLGSREIVVRSCPPFLKGPSIKDFIYKALVFIHEHQTLDQEHFATTFNEFLHGEMACKAAIKAGDKLSLEQMQQLLSDLSVCNNRFKCVHGRPTLWTLDEAELEKKFRRIQP